ncbi:hypothetical protein [Bradyrhizobium archetypum]|uniref:Cysteine rich repeat-containing protein n=1 Tax=Bradyrhizobium archetypum TaxID=2721160 RepID=A0A7Y4M1B2_9BRAD|nr:hypothetical protein [Bradyrhizobium archetypum]NOJ46513.1 hypothetical protein [Bradyrhizobium archetypum]
MINTLTRATKLGPLLAAATYAIAAPALAQAPSQAQRDAIKSQCRSDYIAHCSSVPPGGEAALQCLQKNMSGLSSGCQSAVRAVEVPAAAPGKPAETAKSAEPAKPAETAAPKSAAPAAATPAPAKSGQPKAAAAAAAPAAAGAAATAAPAAPTAIVLRPMRPREELFVLRSACGADVRTICGGVPAGGGRIVQCLATNAAQLSPACKDVLSQFAAR